MKKIIISGVAIIFLLPSCASNKCSSIGCGYSATEVEKPESTYKKDHDTQGVLAP